MRPASVFPFALSGSPIQEMASRRKMVSWQLFSPTAIMISSLVYAASPGCHAKYHSLSFFICFPLPNGESIRTGSRWLRPPKPDCNRRCREGQAFGSVDGKSVSQGRMDGACGIGTRRVGAGEFQVQSLESYFVISVVLAIDVAEVSGFGVQEFIPCSPRRPRLSSCFASFCKTLGLCVKYPGDDGASPSRRIWQASCSVHSRSISCENILRWAVRGERRSDRSDG